MLQPDRDLNKLQPDFRKKVEGFLKDAPRVFVTEAYRSQERQDYLYSLGRTRPGKIVTRTTASNHTLGVAIDIAFYGSELYPAEGRVRQEVADIAKKWGIDRGYDLWGTDKPHFQNNDTQGRDPLVLEAIDKGYYNGVEGNGVTDRAVLLSMKIMKGETSKQACQHSTYDLKHLGIIKPRDGIITYRVHNLTDDISEIKQQILFSNIFIRWEDILKPIQFKRVYEGGADIDIRFSYPGDPELPAPFKEQSIAYAILPLGEIRINDTNQFNISGGKELLYVLTHEVGHLLGVPHNDMPSDVMYSTYSGDKDIKILESTKALCRVRYESYINKTP